MGSLLPCVRRPPSDATVTFTRDVAGAEPFPSIARRVTAAARLHTPRTRLSSYATGLCPPTSSLTSHTTRPPLVGTPTSQPDANHPRTLPPGHPPHRHTTQPTLPATSLSVQPLPSLTRCTLSIMRSSLLLLLAALLASFLPSSLSQSTAQYQWGYLMRCAPNTLDYPCLIQVSGTATVNSTPGYVRHAQRDHQRHQDAVHRRAVLQHPVVHRPRATSPTASASRTWRPSNSPPPRLAPPPPTSTWPRPTSTTRASRSSATPRSSSTAACSPPSGTCPTTRTPARPSCYQGAGNALQNDYTADGGVLHRAGLRGRAVQLRRRRADRVRQP